MKKGICLVICLVLALGAVGAVAHAEESIILRYSYVSSLSASLSISSGTAQAAGKVSPSNNLRTSITVRLQKENSRGRWSTIVVWTGSNESGASEAGGTKVLTSGYNYRVYVTGKVYDSAGEVIETVDKYSAIESY